MVETFKASGLTQSELATLCGVTRVTVNHWFTGRFNPSESIASRVDEIKNKLEASLKSGKLPLPRSVSKARRLDEIRAAIGLTD
jgi:transcriptional regulator with XRE-family HTH domain